MQRPKTVVVGYGFAGRCFHSYLIPLDSGLELHGVASRNPETRKNIEQQRGCKTYESFNEVISDPEVDLVVLATPNSTHAELAIQALDAGKHVVTDKIMCTSLQDCDRMIEAADRSGKLLTVFQNRRWDGDYLTLMKLIGEDELGEVRWAEMAWQGFGAWGGWRGEKSMGGGRLFDLGAHMVDQMCLLIPHTITSVYCRTHYDYPESSVESHAMIVIGFENGATGIVDTSGMNAISKPRFLVHGTKGSFIKHGLDPQEKAMIDEQIDNAVEEESLYGTLNAGKDERRVPTESGRWRNFYENVADVLVNGAEPAIKLPEVRRCMAVFDAALRSAETGNVVQTNI